MAERKAPCPCGSGRQYKACCYPRDRARASALGAAHAAYERVDGVLRVFLPLVESRGEYAIACKDGCDACCSNFVRASVPEAMAIAAYLDEHEDARARFLAKLDGWRARARPELDELCGILQQHGGPPVEEPDRSRYARAGVAFGQKENRCPLNEAGRCDVYPVRPIVCRAVYVLDTAEHCTPGRGVPKRVSHPALDEAVRASGVETAREAARLGEPLYEQPLPEAVARALR